MLVLEVHRRGSGEPMMTMTVQDVMTRGVVVVGERAGFRDVVGLLRKHHLSALPVVDGSGRVVGVVSESDLYLKQAEPLRHRLAPLLRRHRQRLNQSKAAGATVAQLMTTPAVTIRPDQSLTEAATRMYQHGVKRLPVVDDTGAPVGIVTRGDLLKAYLRADEDIRLEIVRESVPKVIERAVETVQVDVHDGVVELDGWVTRRSQALALVARARATDGVIAVHSKLAYDVNDTSDWATRYPAA
jgi:CBS-domain-containing membrane protein